MERKDIELCEALKRKAEDAADRIEQLSDDIETLEGEREDAGSALTDIKDIADGMTAENWQECASEIIKKCEEVL